MVSTTTLVAAWWDLLEITVIQVHSNNSRRQHLSVVIRLVLNVYLLFDYVIPFADIDDCVNHTCSNGGQCEDGVNSYFCNCLVGFTGNNCETGTQTTLRRNLYL